MKITIGFSPCPNDTFIFDALVNHRIDTGGLEFEPVLEDVETLNQWALEGKLDVTKLSYPAFFRSLDQYVLLNAGSALGKGVGPVLVKNPDLESGDLSSLKVLIPGENTTANLLLGFAYPGIRNKRPMLFSEIEDLVLSGLADLGVIIHENRFTYEEKGLKKVADLGSIWEEKTGVPIPLGGIASKRSLGPDMARQVDKLVRQSLETAFANYPLIPDYVHRHAQTMKEDVMRRHIDLYVNAFSLDLGMEGREAIRVLYRVFCTMNQIEEGNPENLFLQGF
ncbi:MAG: 1,4-dihydroxy-6-naphthoate synthase [Chitinophagaceae bacterium]